MSATITVTGADGGVSRHPEGIPVGRLARAPVSPAGLPWIAARVNNDTTSLSYPLAVDATVEFVAMDDPHGWRVYRHSLCFLLAKAVGDVLPQAQLWLEHSLGPGLYCSCRCADRPCEGIAPDRIAAIEARMRELVARDLPIRRRKVAFMDAVRELEAAGQVHKLHLLKYRNPPRIVLHQCEGFSDLAHGPLAPRTGLLDRFALIPYGPGFVLQMPERDAPDRVPPFEDQPQLFEVIQEHKEWGRILGVNTVGRLNETIARGNLEDFVRIAEALHEKKVARIADRIAAARDRLRVILIAGPSSAGKTTFAKRLSVHLTVNGLRPVTLGTDDYFVGADRNPIGPDGKPDYEHIEAVDLALFNAQLAALAGGAEIEPPRFNFETKSREFRGERLRLERDQLLIVEGIHALNPRLTEGTPAESKFKIYVSALTQLNVDSNNRISTTDNRLMRRMVRDSKYRGHTALATLRQWPSVRAGEKRWIFPFQKEADATFNSALDYELAVLKPLVEPLLMQIKPDVPEYAEARRLSGFLLNFLSASSRAVPATSILREYIGGSGFRY